MVKGSIVKSSVKKSTRKRAKFTPLKQTGTSTLNEDVKPENSPAAKDQPTTEKPQSKAMTEDQDVINFTFTTDQLLAKTAPTQIASEVSTANEKTTKSISDTPKDESPVKTTTIHFEMKMTSHALVFFIVFFFVGFLLFGSLILFLKQSKEPDTAVISFPTSTAQVSSSPTPLPTETSEITVVNLTDYKLQVLNGAGRGGIAARTRDLLKTAGFANIDIGNADQFDFTDTEVRRKETVVDQVLITIEEALTGYSVVEGDPLEVDANYDVMIIVGSKLP